MVSRTKTLLPLWSIWQTMHRRITDFPAPVLSLTRMCGDSASRSTETIRPPAPNPMTGADSFALATSSRVFGSLKRDRARGLAGFLHQHVRLAALRVPGERDALEGEFLGDEVGHHVAGEPEPGRQVDTDLGVVVGKVLRDVEVTARVALLRQPERLVQGLVQRAHPLAHQLPPLAGQDHVRRGAHGQDGGRADPGGLQRGERRLPVLPQLRELPQGLAGGVQVPGRQVAALREPTAERQPEGQPAPPGLVGAAANLALHLRQDPSARPPERRVRTPDPVQVPAGQHPGQPAREGVGGLIHLLVELRPCHGRALSVCVPAPHTRNRTPTVKAFTCA